MKRFEEFCNGVSSKTYNNLRNASWMFSAGVGLVGDNLMSQHPMFGTPATVIAYISLALSMYLTFSKGQIHTKDINEVRVLYQEFINNYNELNRIFSLEDPIQIYTMFNYLVNRGYLSKDKSFEFTSKDARDIEGIYGANVIMGKGVCRHISSMLTDILNGHGIDAFNLCCYIRDYSVNVNVIDEPKYLKEELENWIRTNITDDATRKVLFQALKTIEEGGKHAELSLEFKEATNPFERIIGNHAISYANHNGKGYYLDATLSRIYGLAQSDNMMLTGLDGEAIKLKLGLTSLLNSSKDYLRLRPMISNPSPCVSKEEEREIVRATLAVCNSNGDIFDQFYNNNSGLYNEMAGKLTKIRRNIYVRRS